MKGMLLVLNLYNLHFYTLYFIPSTPAHGASSEYSVFALLTSVIVAPAARAPDAEGAMDTTMRPGAVLACCVSASAQAWTRVPQQSKKAQGQSALMPAAGEGG